MTATILAFDTSGAHCAAGLHWGDGHMSTRFEEMSRGQGERLVVLLEEPLADEGFSWQDLDALAVGVGPVNFTGIRIAVSAARGLALALKIPIIGVSNFEIMRGVNSVTDKTEQLVSLAAPRDMVYLQSFAGGRASGQPSIARVGAGIDPVGISPDMSVLGQNASDIMTLHLLDKSHDQSRLRDAFDRVLPTRELPETMVRIAASKWKLGQVDETRPAPLYVKPPDAAPSRDAAPVILP